MSKRPSIADILKTHGVQPTQELLEALGTTSRKDTGPYEALKTTFPAKTPLQMRLAVLALSKAGKPLSLDEWCKALEAEELYESRQETVKIITYYRKPMIEGGYIKRS